MYTGWLKSCVVQCDYRKATAWLKGEPDGSFILLYGAKATQRTSSEIAFCRQMASSDEEAAAMLAIPDEKTVRIWVSKSGDIKRYTATTIHMLTLNSLEGWCKNFSEATGNAVTPEKMVNPHAMYMV